MFKPGDVVVDREGRKGVVASREQVIAAWNVNLWNEYHDEEYVWAYWYGPMEKPYRLTSSHCRLVRAVRKLPEWF